MSDSTIYDVAIIGGGLAGLSLAIQSAKQGYSVLLFEKENYPFHKVCGEYISLESWNFLESLGVPLSNLQLPIIKKLEATDTSGKIYNFNLPQGGFGISRFLLDDTLYQIALKLGVKILVNTKVNHVLFAQEQFRIETQSGDYFSKVAAGSYGKRSNLDVKLNRNFVGKKAGKLENYIGVKYHVEYPQAIDTIALHNFENGYCGISNIGGNKCCLCYLTTAHNLKISGNSISAMEKNILGKNSALKKIFAECKILYDQPLVISQISFSNKTQVEDHMLIMGDAAGMITPLCGNGMSMAMHGSKIAFSFIDMFLKKQANRQQMELGYTLKWKAEFGVRLRIGRIVQHLFGGVASTSLFLKTMKAFPALAKQVIKSTHGKPF
jgi:flavin-dependent dehydrogenase